MKKLDLGSWLQIAANLGILAGLVLVAIQISQTNSLTGYQLNAGNYETLIGQMIATAGENPQESMYRVLLEPESATDEDYFVVDHLYHALLSQVHRIIYLSGAGLTGDNNLEGSLRSRSRWFGCPYGLAYLDDTIENFPDDSIYRHALKRMRDYAGSRPNWRTTLDARKKRTSESDDA